MKILNYNLLEENWIRIQYLDGTTGKLGINEVLQKADQIKDILPPVFRGDTAYIYYVLVIKLLTTIIMSAYYKEEIGFASKNLRYLEELRANGVYSDVIKNYLEKYHDRFDILSDTHPFLQNIALKSEFDNVKEGDMSYLAWNPFAPSENNTVFGKNRKRRLKGGGSSILEQYLISPEEFTYLLLYFATIGNSPASTVSKEGSLGRAMSIFVVIKGKNLKETLCNNILKLNESSRPLEDDTKPDMPVWEMDNIKDILKYDNEEIARNILCRAFYPGISILGMGFDEYGYLKGMVRVRNKIAEKEYGLPLENTKALAKTIPDPMAIVTHKEDAESGDVRMSARQFDAKTDTAVALCICATKHTDKWDNCTILNNTEQIKDGNVSIYFRTLDDNYITMFGCGSINGHNAATWDKLKKEEEHERAIKYQNNYNTIRTTLRGCISKTFFKADNIADNILRQLSDWMEEDFFGKFSDCLQNEDVVIEATRRLGAEALRLFDNCIDQAGNIMTGIAEKKNLKNKINKLTQQRR